MGIAIQRGRSRPTAEYTVRSGSAGLVGARMLDARSLHDLSGGSWYCGVHCAVRFGTGGARMYARVSGGGCRNAEGTTVAMYFGSAGC